MDSVKPPSRLLYTKWSSLTLPIALLSPISNIKPSQSNQTERPAYRMTLTHTHTYTHTLFKNTQQTCMNKIQMTITKEKKITKHT